MARSMRLAGATAVLLSLWMPWYGIHLPDGLQSQIDARAGEMPPGFAAFAKGLLAAMPQNLHVSAWQAFGGADVAMAFLAGGLVLLCFVAADRALSVAGAVALAGLVAVHIVDRPGPSGFATLKAGPWVALLGALTALASTLISEPAPEPAADLAPAWAAPAAGSDTSVAPPR
ncbi:MAG: hypothetical protein ACXVFN_11200 [Solirubrobacteraceae bacterium]